MPNQNQNESLLLFKFSFEVSTEPKSRSIAAFKSPCKVVPFSMISRISCGLHDRLRCYVMQYVFQLGFLSNWLINWPAHISENSAGKVSNTAFALFTYAWWCLEW